MITEILYFNLLFNYNYNNNSIIILYFSTVSISTDPTANSLNQNPIQQILHLGAVVTGIPET